MNLEIKNPHSVLAAIVTRPHDVLEVRISAARPHGAWQEVVDQAGRSRIPVRKAAALRGRGRSGGSSRASAGRTPAATAVIRPRAAVSPTELFSAASAERPQNRPHAGGSSRPRLWLGLDGLQDPHNVGAVFRAAAFFGVAGIVATERRSAPMNEVVYDVASGGVEYVPFALVPSLQGAIRLAREAGLWVLGTSEHAERDVLEIDRERDWFVIVGSEESGIRRLTGQECDELCRIAPRGGIGSLNVAVATGAILALLTSSPSRC